MGIFDNLFGKKNEVTTSSDDVKRYDELIRFISFFQKIKPLIGGNYGINVTYHAPEQGYTGKVRANFGLYDFNEIHFAHEYALKGNTAQMVQYYYKKISEQAGLNQSDWPHRIDADDFLDVLQGTYYGSYFSVVPDEYNDDIFTFKVVVGLDSRNAIQVFNAVINVVKTRFPELKVTKNHATAYSMSLTIHI